MTLRSRILLYYSATLSFSLVIVGFWCWFEFSEQIERVVTRSKEEVLRHSAAEETAEILLFGGIPAVLLGIVGGLFLMRRALRPIGDLTQQLERTDVSNLSEQVPRSGNGDELDRMAAVFNLMKERLGVSFTQTREFTLHASHELKTPLTIMHSTLEQMVGDPDSPSAHRERIASLLEEVQRLSRIVGQLAFLAKADAGLIAVVHEPVAFDELVREVVEDAVILATGTDITLTLEECAAVIVSGKRMRLRQLLLNLADNAVKHNFAGGRVTFSLRQQGGCAQLQIINTGPVLPPEQLARVFERFFRGNSSYGTKVEGCGLGLSISESIVQAHGGTISMTDEGDGFTRVTVMLPAGSDA